MQMRIFIGWCVPVCVRCMSAHFHRQTGTDKLEQLNFTKRLFIHNEELLYCVYSELKMGRHDTFAHKALQPSLRTFVFVGVQHRSNVTKHR